MFAASLLQVDSWYWMCCKLPAITCSLHGIDSFHYEIQSRFQRTRLAFSRSIQMFANPLDHNQCNGDFVKTRDGYTLAYKRGFFLMEGRNCSRSWIWIFIHHLPLQNARWWIHQSNANVMAARRSNRIHSSTISHSWCLCIIQYSSTVHDSLIFIENDIGYGMHWNL